MTPTMLRVALKVLGALALAVVYVAWGKTTEEFFPSPPWMFLSGYLCGIALPHIFDWMTK